MRFSAAAIGTFDGVHRGHQRLLEKLVEVSRKRGLRSIVIALERPVRPVSGVLTTPREKKTFLARFPVDRIVIVPVGPELTDQPAEDFFNGFLLGKLRVKHLVVGKNFAFGHNRAGTVEWLKAVAPAKGVEVSVVLPRCFRGEPVSSSRIRKLLLESDLDGANRLLGRTYQFEGTAVRGRGIARTLGAPTINLEVAQGKLLPRGVFAAEAGSGKRWWPSVVNIGTRPTFFEDGALMPEVTLLGFKGAWRERRMGVRLCRFLRKEIKFNTPAELKEQIHADIRQAKTYFGAREKNET
ncbi:MAG: riboflavin biosynthesis protein RibF [Endomicrobiales bacterium]